MKSDNGVMSMNIVDLFCGIGGLKNGFVSEGANSILSVDNWHDAITTHKFNFPKSQTLIQDLSNPTEQFLDELTSNRKRIDGIIGGPPCQGYSTVGERIIGDKRNNLWSAVLHATYLAKPTFVLLENVEGIIHLGDGHFPQKIKSEFEKLGYTADWQIVTSANFGVPQLRKRFIFIAVNSKVHCGFPMQTHSEYGDLFDTIPWVTVNDAISDLPSLNAGETKEHYEQKPKTEYQKEMRENSEVLKNHAAAKHAPHLVEMISHIPDGGNRKSIPPHLQPKSGFHNSYARLASWKPAVAVTSNLRKPSSARAIHPKQNRGLTVREGLRLQGFKDSFEIKGTRTSQYLQVGNAVPVQLARAFAKHLREKI